MTTEISPEEEYYVRHYDGGVAAGTTPLASFEREMLAPGKRYHVAAQAVALTASPGSLVAEVGCGGGEALMILQKRHALERVIGLDIAATPSGAMPPGIEIIASNLNRPWPLEDGSVDFLLAMMVIEHLFDPFQAFAEVRRVLKPDGLAFVNLPLVTALRNRFRLLTGRLPVTSVNYERWFGNREWDGNHLHYFSIPAIRRLADATGLSFGEIAAVGPHQRLKELAPSLLASEITFVLRRANGPHE